MPSINRRKPRNPAKVADIGLAPAVVQFTKEGEKSIATTIEFVPAKGE